MSKEQGHTSNLVYSDEDCTNFIAFATNMHKHIYDLLSLDIDDICIF